MRSGVEEWNLFILECGNGQRHHRCLSWSPAHCTCAAWLHECGQNVAHQAEFFRWEKPWEDVIFPYFQCYSRSIVDINHAQGTALGFQVWSNGGHPTSPLQERLHRPHSPGDRFQILAEGGVFVFCTKKAWNIGSFQNMESYFAPLGAIWDACYLICMLPDLWIWWDTHG